MILNIFHICAHYSGKSTPVSFLIFLSELRINILSAYVKFQDHSLHQNPYLVCAPQRYSFQNVGADACRPMLTTLQKWPRETWVSSPRNGCPLHKLLAIPFNRAAACVRRGSRAFQDKCGCSTRSCKHIRYKYIYGELGLFCSPPETNLTNTWGNCGNHFCAPPRLSHSSPLG